MARILVVEDTSAVLALYKDVLEERGHEVDTATDGDTALQKLEKKPELLILDLHLPKGGFELLDKIRAQFGRELRVIVVSGVYRGTVHREALTKKHKIVAYLDKPIELDTFTANVDAALATENPKDLPYAPLSSLILPGDNLAEPSKANLRAKDSASDGVRGRLDDVPFARLLGNLYARRADGALMMKKGTVKKIVYLKAGTPIFVRSNLVHECLGHVMVRERLIDARECELSVERMRAEKRKQGEILIEMSAISAKNLEYALERQMEIKLFDLFGWTEGQYLFNEQKAQPGVEIPMSSSVLEILTEGIRRGMPERRILADIARMSDAPLAPPDPASREKLLDHEPRFEPVLAKIDDKRSLLALAREPESGAVWAALYAAACLNLLGPAQSKVLSAEPPPLRTNASRAGLEAARTKAREAAEASKARIPKLPSGALSSPAGIAPDRPTAPEPESMMVIRDGPVTLPLPRRRRRATPEPPTREIQVIELTPEDAEPLEDEDLDELEAELIEIGPDSRSIVADSPLKKERVEVAELAGDKVSENPFAEREKLAAERAAVERAAAERAAAERAAAERAAAERAAAEKAVAEKERLAAERAVAEKERLAAEKAVAEKERLAAEELAAEKAAAKKEKLAAEKAAADEEKLAAEKAAAERLATEKAAAERLAAEKAAAAKAAVEKERLAAEKADADRVAAEKLEAEKIAAERERLAAERAAAERMAVEKLAAERLVAEREELAADKAAEKLAAEKAVAERVAAEKLAAERLVAEREKLAAEKAERLAAEEKLAAERATAEKLAAENGRLVVGKAVTEREKLAAQRLAAEKAIAERGRLLTERLQAEKSAAHRDAFDSAEHESSLANSQPPDEPPPWAQRGPFGTAVDVPSLSRDGLTPRRIQLPQPIVSAVLSPLPPDSAPLEQPKPSVPPSLRPRPSAPPPVRPSVPAPKATREPTPEPARNPTFAALLDPSTTGPAVRRTEPPPAPRVDLLRPEPRSLRLDDDEYVPVSRPIPRPPPPPPPDEPFEDEPTDNSERWAAQALSAKASVPAQARGTSLAEIPTETSAVVPELSTLGPGEEMAIRAARLLSAPFDEEFSSAPTEEIPALTRPPPEPLPSVDVPNLAPSRIEVLRDGVPEERTRSARDPSLIARPPPPPDESIQPEVVRQDEISALRVRLEEARARLRNRNHYERLGLDRSATKADVELAEESVQRAWVDALPSDAPWTLRLLAEEVGAMLAESARILGNSGARRAYNRTLDGRAPAQRLARSIAAEKAFQAAARIPDEPAARIEALRHAVELDGRQAAYHAGLAAALFAQDPKSEDARASLARALEWDGSHEPAIVLAAKMAAQKGDLDTARSRYEAALLSDPDNIVALTGLRALGKPAEKKSFLKRISGS
ncbi:MAG: response regulator [Deltaproteobacteria bacterium]|nr:response regulator [Deltaproteobacteria bacterium]